MFSSTSKVNMDSRFNSPAFFFTHKCQCKGNFDGPNCGRCKPKYTGTNCDALLPCTRRELRQLSRREQIDFIVILNFCKEQTDPEYSIMSAGDIFDSSSYKFSDASYYNVWCYQRYYAHQSFINNSRASSSPTFLYGAASMMTWNRVSLLFLEQQLGRCMQNYSICLPYYDWTIDSRCEACKDDLFGSTGPNGFLNSGNVFSYWKVSSMMGEGR
ncbi:tyrosinase-like [Leptodactylus fuscus]